MLRLVLFLMVFPQSILWAQIFNPYVFPDFTAHDYFEPSFIRSRNIKSATFTLRKKPDHKPVSPVHLIRTVQYDSLGYPLKIEQISPSGSWSDTLVSYMRYDEKHRLILLRSHDAFGFYRLEFIYDSLNRIKSEKFLREGPGGRIYLVAEETAVYKDFGTQVKKTVHNAAGLPYKESISYYDGSTLTGISEKSYIGGSGREVTWNFREGRLTSFDRTDRMLNQTEKYLLERNEEGEISGWKLQINNRLIETGSVGYSSSLPVDLVVRNEVEKEIEIIRIEFARD